MPSDKEIRLAIVVTHPIQYNVPLFKLLSERKRIRVMVFYTWGESALADKYDPGFNRIIEWDIPLLSGYPYRLVKNTSSSPGSHRFSGIVNPDIIDQLKNWEPNALLVYGWNFNSHLKIMRHFKGKIPIFFRGDSTLLNDRNGLRSMLRRIALRWVYRKVDKALYVGANNKRYFEVAGLGEDQLVLAPHAVDNAFFQDKNEEHETAAKKWRSMLGIGEQDLVFLFAGKLEPNKSPLLLLEAFSKCNFYLPTWLVFTGNGNLEAALKEKTAKERATKANVRFIDFQNQSAMPVIYRLGDVLVLPSQSETWGLAINEAMASGRPVIASSKCGGAVDLVIDGINGYIFRSGEVDHLREKMETIAGSREKMGEMRRNAQLHIRQFSLESVAETIEKEIIEWRD